MSKSTFKKAGIAMLCALVIFSACKKEDKPTPQQAPDTGINQRISGVAPDDPALEAKVPVIVSADFLKIENQAARKVKSGIDVTSPTVNITSPTNGSTVSGTINISVNASDNVGVSSVSLSVDGTVIGTRTSAPYSFSWTVTTGSHTLTATAKDAAGNSASNSITVSQNTVTSDQTPPSVTITSPVNGAAISGTVNITVSASDNVGVSSVSYSVDGTSIGTSTTAPFSLSWNTTSVTDGTHTLVARALDAAGNATTSSILISKNTTTLPPSTSLPSNVILATPTPGNQGGEGSCVSFAVVYGQRSIEQYYKTGATSFSYSTNIFSPEYVFNQINGGSCGSSTLLGNYGTLVNQGVCTWASMPYTDLNGCSQMPGSSQTAEAVNYKIASYSKVYSTDLTAAKTLIASKHPLAISIVYDNTFLNATAGTIWKTLSGGPFGPHAVLLVGYDDSKHAFKAMNSWGTNWGDGGFIWIDYDLLPSICNNLYSMTL